MKRRIVENITRQLQALKVLNALQLEEFAHLCEFRPQSVSALEFSIQELMRQIHAERREAKALVPQLDPAAVRLSDLRPAMGEDWAGMERILAEIDRYEQTCAKQAEKSYQMALALFDQSGGYIEFFRNKLVRPKTTYGPRGVIAQGKPAPAMFRGAM